MKTDLGILLLLLGFTLAYLVMAGKFPTSAPIVTSGSITSGGAFPSPSPSPQPTPTGGRRVGGGPGGSTPMGLPTMGYFHDLVASQGGLQ